MSIGMQIKQMRQKKSLSQADLAKRLHVHQTAVSQWENDRTSPDSDLLPLIADIFEISVDQLLGRESKQKKAIKRTVPVLGTIPAGIPIEAIEEVLDYEDLSPEEANDGYEYFGLRIRGNSMYPEYQDGDTIIVRKQDTAETGDDAVVMVNGDDATFKRIKRDTQGIILMPINTADFQPMFYSNKDIFELPVRILGICVELRRKKR
jgi:repressor LexA